MAEFFYHLVHQTTLFLPRLGCEIFRDGFEHVPKTGPALLVCNHISHFDPGFMGLDFPRIIHFMADKPLLEIPVYGWFLKKGHVFPIDRTKTDRAALRTTMARLEAGNLVCIFPEQGIRHGKTSVLGGAELAVGTASLWKMANVPLIPMILIGSDQMYDWKNVLRRPRRRVFTRIGPALQADKSASREELRDRIVAAWRDIFESLQRDYKIRPEELPQSAQQRLGWPEPEAARAAAGH